MNESRNQGGTGLQRIDGGRGGWRLPALLVAGVLIGVVVVARLGMEPDSSSSGLAPTLRPAATATPEPARPQPSAPPTAEPDPPLEGIRLGPGPSQVWIGRYADGIPLRMNDLPVRRVADVLARQPSGTALVGGWYIGLSCGRRVTSGACPHGRMADSPANVNNVAESVRLVGRGVPVDRAGPAVFQADVEVTCEPGCEATMTVREALWLGDPLTETGPIGVLPLLTALSDAFPGLTATPVHERPDCPIMPPAQAYRLSGAGVRAALIYPTVADREAAEGPVRIGQRVMLIEEGGECRQPPLPRDNATWIAHENVMLLVDTARPLTAEQARAALDDARARTGEVGPDEAGPISAWQALSTLWRAYPGLVVVPGAEQALPVELPDASWILRGADAGLLAVFPDRRARRAIDVADLPRFVSVPGGIDLRLRWIGTQNLLLGVSGGRAAAERVGDLFRQATE